MILDGYKKNYQTLIDAISNNDTALVECVSATTGKLVYVVCAVTQVGDQIDLTPLAKMFDENPYEELVPPMSKEELH